MSWDGIESSVGNTGLFIAELQVFLVTQVERKHVRQRAISTKLRFELSSRVFFTCNARLPQNFMPFWEKTLGEHAPSYTTVKKWVAQFKCGDFSTFSAPRFGRHKTVTTMKFFDQLKWRDSKLINFLRKIPKEQTSATRIFFKQK